MIDQNTPSDAYVSPESTGASAEDIVNRFESEEALVSAVANLSPTEFVDRYASDSPQNGKKLYDDVSFALQKQKEEMLIQKASQMEGPYAPNEYAELPGWIPFIGGSYAPGDVSTNGAKGALATLMQATGSVDKAISDSAKTLFDKDLAYSGVSSGDLTQRRQTLKDVENTDLGYVDEDTKEYARNIRTKLDRQKELRDIIENSYNAEEKAKAEQELSTLSLNQAEFDFSQTDTYKNIVKFEDARAREEEFSRLENNLRNHWGLNNQRYQKALSNPKNVGDAFIKIRSMLADTSGLLTVSAASGGVLGRAGGLAAKAFNLGYKGIYTGSNAAVLSGFSLWKPITWGKGVKVVTSGKWVVPAMKHVGLSTASVLPMTMQESAENRAEAIFKKYENGMPTNLTTGDQITLLGAALINDVGTAMLPTMRFIPKLGKSAAFNKAANTAFLEVTKEFPKITAKAMENSMATGISFTKGVRAAVATEAFKALEKYGKDGLVVGELKAFANYLGALTQDSIALGLTTFVQQAMKDMTAAGYLRSEDFVSAVVDYMTGSDYSKNKRESFYAGLMAIPLAAPRASADFSEASRNALKYSYDKKIRDYRNVALFNSDEAIEYDRLDRILDQPRVDKATYAKNAKEITKAVQSRDVATIAAKTGLSSEYVQNVLEASDPVDAIVGFTDMMGVTLDKVKKIKSRQAELESVYRDKVTSGVAGLSIGPKDVYKKGASGSNRFIRHFKEIVNMSSNKQALGELALAYRNYALTKDATYKDQINQILKDNAHNSEFSLANAALRRVSDEMYTSHKFDNEIGKYASKLRDSSSTSKVETNTNPLDAIWDSDEDLKNLWEKAGSAALTDDDRSKVIQIRARIQDVINRYTAGRTAANAAEYDAVIKKGHALLQSIDALGNVSNTARTLAERFKVEDIQDLIASSPAELAKLEGTPIGEAVKLQKFTGNSITGSGKKGILVHLSDMFEMAAKQDLAGILGRLKYLVEWSDVHHGLFPTQVPEVKLRDTQLKDTPNGDQIAKTEFKLLQDITATYFPMLEKFLDLTADPQDTMLYHVKEAMKSLSDTYLQGATPFDVNSKEIPSLERYVQAVVTSLKIAQRSSEGATEKAEKYAKEQSKSKSTTSYEVPKEVRDNIDSKAGSILSENTPFFTSADKDKSKTGLGKSIMGTLSKIFPSFFISPEVTKNYPPLMDVNKGNGTEKPNKRVDGDIHFSKIAYNLGVKDIIRLLRATASIKAEIPVNLIHSIIPANPKEKQLTGFIRKVQMDANADMGMHLYNILKLFTAADLGSLSAYSKKIRYHQNKGNPALRDKYVLEERKIKHNSYEFIAEILANLYKGVYLTEGTAESDAEALYSLFKTETVQGTAELPRDRNIEAVFNNIISNNDTQAFSTPLLENLFRNTAFYGIVSPWMDSAISKYNTNNANENDNLAKIARISSDSNVKAYLQAHNINTFNELLTNYNNNREAIRNLNPDLESALKSISINKQAADVLGRIPLAIQAGFLPVQPIPGGLLRWEYKPEKAKEVLLKLGKQDINLDNPNGFFNLFGIMFEDASGNLTKPEDVTDFYQKISQENLRLYEANKLSGTGTNTNTNTNTGTGTGTGTPEVDPAKQQRIVATNNLIRSMILPKSTDAVTYTPTDTRNLIIRSGGAYGADTLWGVMARANGVPKDHIIHYLGHTKDNSLTSLNELGFEKYTGTTLDLAPEAEARYKEYAEKHGIKVGSEEALRGISQVLGENLTDPADAVVAVAPLNLTSESGNVSGSTDTAVNVAIINNIPTLVLNTNDNKWYFYNSSKNKWAEENAIGFIDFYKKKESFTIAMIGTRNINYEGNSYLENDNYKHKALTNSASLINEMRRVFLKEMETKGSNPPPQEVTPTDAELTNQINDEIISAYNAEKTKEEENTSNEGENTENSSIDDVAVDPSDVNVDEEESILESSVSGAEVANNIAYLYGLFKDIDLTTNKAEAIKRLQNILENPKNIGNIAISDKTTVFKTRYIERLAEFYNQYKGDNATNKAIRENIVSSVVDHYILYNNIRNSLYNHLVVSSTNENEVTIGKDIEAINSKYANKHRYIFSVLQERGITPQSLDKELSNPDGNFVEVFRNTLRNLLGTSTAEAEIRDLIRNPYTVLKMGKYLLDYSNKTYDELYSDFDKQFNTNTHYKFSKNKVFKPVLTAFYNALLSLNNSEALNGDSLKEAVNRVVEGESTLGTAYFRDSTVPSTEEFKNDVSVAKQAITGTLLNSPAIRAKFASSLTGFIFTDLVKASSKEVNVSSLAPFSGLSVDRPVAEHISAILSKENGEELYKELTTRPNLGKVSTLVTKLGKYLVTKAGVGKILSEFSKDGKPLTAYQKNLINIMLGQVALKHLTGLQYIALSGMNDNSLALVPDLVYDENSNSFQVRQPKNSSSKTYLFSGEGSLFQEVKNLANQDKTKAFSDYVLATAFGEKHVSYTGLVKVSSKNSQGERVPKEYKEATQKYVDQGFAIDPQIMSLFTEILDREFTVNGMTKTIRDFFIGWLNNYDENTANVFLDKVFGSNALKELEALNMFLGLEDPRTVFEYDAVGIVARNRETIKALLNLSMAQAKWEAAKNEIDDTITDTETYDNSWVLDNWEELKNSPYIHAWFSVNPGSNFRCFQQGVEYNPSSQKSFTRYTMYRAPNVMESASLAYNRENAYRVNQVLSYSILQNFDQKPEKKVQWDQFTDKAKELINRLDKNRDLTRLLQAYKAHGYRYEDAGLWKAMFNHMEAEGLELENTKIQMLNIVKTLAQFTDSNGELQFTKTGLFEADGRKVYNYILAETDGVTNGSAIGLITNLGLLDPTQEGLITDKEWDFLNKVGIYKATGDGPKSIHEYYYDESGNKKGTTDMYENLQEKFSIEGITRVGNGQYVLDDYETSNLLKLVLVVKYGLLDQEAINSKIDEIWKKMPTSPKGYTLDFAKEVKDYLKDPSKRISENAYAFRQVYQEFFRHVLERSDTKYPFMTFNYSAGVQAITRDLLINRMLPEALKHLTKDLNSTKDPMAKKTKVITFFRLVAQLCSNTEYSTFATPQNLNRLGQKFQNKAITPDDEAEFSRIFGISMNDAIKKYGHIGNAILSGALLPFKFKSMSSLLEKLENAESFTMNDVSSNLTNKLIEAMVKPFSSVIGEPLFETMYKEFPQIKTTVGVVTSAIPVLAQAVYTISNRAKQVLIATYNKAHPDATVTWENATKELKQNYEQFIRRFTESFKSPFGGALPLAEFLKGQDASQGYLRANGFDIKGTSKNAVFTSPEKQGVTDRGASYSVLGVQSTDAAIAAFVKQVVGGLFLDIYDANFSSGWFMPEVAKAQNRGCATYTIKSATSSIVIACENAFQTFLDQANWKDNKLGIDLSNEFRSIIANSLYRAAHGSAILESGLSDPVSPFLNFYKEDEGTILPSELDKKVEEYSKDNAEGLDYVSTFLETPAEFQAALDSDVHSVKVELPPNLQKVHKLFSAAGAAYAEMTQHPDRKSQVIEKLSKRMDKSLKKFNIPLTNYLNFVDKFATYNIESTRVVDFLLNHPNLDDAVLKALFTYPDSLNGSAVYHADDAAKIATPAYTKQNLALFSVSPLVHCKAYKDAHSAALKNLNKSGLVVSQYNMNKGGEYVIEPDTEDFTYAESENTANGLFTKLDYEKALENTDPKIIKEVKRLIQKFRNSVPIKTLNVKGRTNEKEDKRNRARFSKLDFNKIADSFYDIVNQVINGYLDKIEALNEDALPVKQYPMSAEKLAKVAGFDPNNSEHIAISRRLNDAIFTYDGILSILNDLNKPETWLRGKAKLRELAKYTKIDNIYAALAGMGKIFHERNIDDNWKDKTLDLGDYKGSVTDTEQVIPSTKNPPVVPIVEPADTQLSRTFEGVEEGVANFVDALTDIIADEDKSAGSNAFYSDATMKDVETLTLSEFNALDVFDRLPDDTAAIGSDTVKLCSEPHKGFLRSLVEKSMKGIKALTMVLGTTDKDYNYGLAQKSIGSIDAKRIALYRSLNAVKKSGLPYSMQELMAHELTHMVWWSLDNADPLYQELRQAYAKFRSSYTRPEDFMILKGLTPGSAEYQAELAAAQKRMDYIFGTGKDSAKDPIREFATFAMTNETFRDMLARVPTEQETKKTGLAGLLETIADIFGRLIDKLFGKAEAGKFKRTENLLTTIDAIHTIALERMSSYREISKIAKVADASAQTLDKLDTKLKTVTDKISLSSGIKSFMATDFGKKLRSAKFLGELAGELGIDGSPENLRKGLLFSMINHVAKINKARQQQIGIDTKFLRESFKNTTLSPHTSKALTEGILRTDLQSLKEGTNYDYIYKIMTDSVYRASELQRARNEIIALEPSAKAFLINSCNSLANYMVKGKYLYDFCNHSNCYQIANLWGIGNKPAVSNNLDRRIALCNSYTTLKAYELLDDNTKNILAETAEKEFEASFKDNGIITLINYQENHLKEGYKAAGKDYIRVLHKGYLKDKTNPYYRVVKSYNKDSYVDLIKKGFEEFQAPNALSIPKGSNKKYLYNTIASPNIYVTGAIATIDNKARGYSVISEPDTKSYGVPITQYKKDRCNSFIRSKMADINKFLTIEDYSYNNENPTLNTAFDFSGSIVDLQENMTNEFKDTILERSHDFSELAARTAASYTEITDSIHNNEILMKVLVQDQLENQADIAANPETWINVSPQSTGAGLEAYIMLPEETKRFVRSLVGEQGLYVRLPIFNQVFGYREKTLVNLMENQHILNKMDLPFKCLSSFINEALGNKAGMHFGGYWRFATAYAKDTIVVRSFLTTFFNILSNMVLLLHNGIPLYDVLKSHVDGYRHISQYKKALSRVTSLENELSYKANSTEKALELQKEYALAKADLISNPMYEIMQKGALTTIEADEASTDYGILGKKLAPSLENFHNKMLQSNSKAIIAMRNMLMVHGSTFYKLAQDFASGSDTIAKWVMYKNDVRSRGSEKDKNNAFLDAADLFVNYDLPTNEWIQWANQVGLMNFTKFMFRIGRPLLKLTSKHPARVLGYLSLKMMLISLGFTPFSFDAYTAAAWNPSKWTSKLAQGLQGGPVGSSMIEELPVVNLWRALS